MELKEYQKSALDQIQSYLQWLSKGKEEATRRFQSLSSELEEEPFDFPKAAWNKVSNRQYHSRKNGLGEDLSDFYIKRAFKKRI